MPSKAMGHRPTRHLPMMTVAIYRLPVVAGTKYFEVVAAQQGGLVGGGNQVVFPTGFKVDPSWIQKL